MSLSRVIGILLLIAGIILFFANIGTVIDVTNDYISELNINNTESTETLTVPDSDTVRAKNVSEAMEPSSTQVRNLALSAIQSGHAGAFTVQQICDIYEYLKNNWTYVSDPNGLDYLAKASESAELMKGDCDDFAILMASCVEAIGGTARVNIAFSTTDGHAYAEVYVTNNASDMKKIADEISNRYGGKNINYRTFTNANGEQEYWLNLDWTAVNPGGEYYSSVGTVLTIQSNGSYMRYVIC